MQYLRSKKISIIVLLVLITAGIFWLEKARMPGNYTFQRDDSESKLLTSLKSSERDSDQDGLKDWEEIIWKTDPNNPDTDGDGTPDGEEARVGRNPAKPGPNDEIMPSSSQTKYESIDFSVSNQSEDLSLMDTVSREFFASYLSGGQITQKEQEDLIGSFLSYVADYKIEDEYKLSDIKISSVSGKEKAKDYGNKAGDILNKYTRHLSENELDIFMQAVGTQNQIELRKLNSYSLAYKAIVADLLSLEAPADFSSLHLALINNLNNVGRAVEYMGKTFSDPILGTAGMTQYVEEARLSQSILKDIKDYFGNKQIIFSENEPGYIFISSIQ